MPPSTLHQPVNERIAFEKLKGTIVGSRFQSFWPERRKWDPWHFARRGSSPPATAARATNFPHHQQNQSPHNSSPHGARLGSHAGSRRTEVVRGLGAPRLARFISALSGSQSRIVAKPPFRQHDRTASNRRKSVPFGTDTARNTTHAADWVATQLPSCKDKSSRGAIMADHDDAQDYTANGPTDIGFRTDGTGIEKGVVAFGHQIGVQGSSVGGDTGSFFCGVFGESHVGIGVQGHSKNMTGVIGMSDNGNGVQGFGGKQGNGVSGFSDSNVGVTGTSNSDDGIVGISKGDRKSGVFGDHADTTKVTFGVSGRSQSPHGSGVNGFSDPGVGVRGTSTTNDGIVGTSSGDRKSGVFGDHTDKTRVTFGVSGRCQSPQGAGRIWVLRRRLRRAIQRGARSAAPAAWDDSWTPDYWKSPGWRVLC